MPYLFLFPPERFNLTTANHLLSIACRAESYFKMGFPKGRQERSQNSSFYVAVGALFVACLLVGVWVYSGPAAIPEGSTVKSSTDSSAVTPRPDDVASPSDESESDSAPTDETPDVFQSDEALEESVEQETPSTETVQDLPPVNPAQSDVPTVNTEVPSSWESQGEESKEEKEAVVEETAPDTSLSATTNSRAPVTEEQRTIEEQQEIAKTPAVIEEEVGQNHDEKFKWKLCDWEGSQDYIPCLDNKKWLDEHSHHKHYEHRERHCPSPEDLPKCLVPMPPAYKPHIKWPESRNQVSIIYHRISRFLNARCFLESVQRK